jgi:DNA repair photolyase
VGFFLPKDGKDKIYVKLNAPFLLKAKLPRLKEEVTITISTATDPYQPIEKKYLLTRKILTLLSEKRLKVRIITKSALVTRDIDVLKNLYDVNVGFTLTTLNERIREVFEPYASTVSERLRALEFLSNKGISTWVFVAPILPYFFEKEGERLLVTAKSAGAKYVLVDKLNYINRIPLLSVISKNFPSLIPFYKRLSSTYFERYRKMFAQICEQIQLPCSFCW